MNINNSKKKNIVRQLFDLDSSVYTDERYPEKVNTGGEYSYLMRKNLCFEMLRNVDENKLLLEIGCGPGIYTKELIDMGFRVLAIDLSWKMLTEAKNAVNGKNNKIFADFIQAEVSLIPLKHSSIDAVLCIGVLAYVDDLSATLEEIYKVLKPGGYAILQMSNKYSPAEIENRIIQYIKNKRCIVQDKKMVLLEEAKLLSFSPCKFEILCKEAGFQALEACYYGFRSRVLEYISQRIALDIAKRCSIFARSKVVGKLGEGYLVKAIK